MTLEERAEQFLTEEKKVSTYEVETFCDRNGFGRYPTKKLLIEFAKLHAKAKLEEAAKKAKVKIETCCECDCDQTERMDCRDISYGVDKESITNISLD